MDSSPCNRTQPRARNTQHNTTQVAPESLESREGAGLGCYLRWVRLLGGAAAAAAVADRAAPGEADEWLSATQAGWAQFCVDPNMFCMPRRGGVLWRK
jgi:hypothetical protein